MEVAETDGRTMQIISNTTLLLSLLTTDVNSRKLSVEEERLASSWPMMIEHNYYRIKRSVGISHVSSTVVTLVE